MKDEIFFRFRSAPRLTRIDIALTLIPALLWLGGVYSRSSLIHPRCSSDPQSCSTSSLLPIDQPSLGLENTPADQYSFFTQNFSGYLAIAAPLLWNGGRYLSGSLTLPLTLSAIGVDWVLFAETATWNGVATEASHLLTQRPRPYVYSDPKRGIEGSNYTSFYSGHTSFAAAASTSILFMLLGRNAPWLLVLAAGCCAQALILSTAIFRVLAGRHFVTDVLVGAIAGSLIALLVALLHRPRVRSES